MRRWDTLVGAWPDQPRFAPRQPGCRGPRLEHVFPSGRTAILECLRLAGVGPEAIVATPECVTGCVAASVQRRARPVPLQAALAAGGGPPAAVILYEQWGWPLPADAVDAVETRLRGVPVVLDRVDSADFLAAPRTYGAFEVVSLSKVLGLDAGGLARECRGRTYLRSESWRGTPAAPAATRPRLLSHPAVRELFKQSDHVHPAVVGWLEDNCVAGAVEAERRVRATAARTVLDSRLAVGWPTWMAAALEAGAGPVWAPVLRGSSPDILWQAVAILAHDWRVAAPVRMFNWTGNPLSPRYEPAVALPIHGGVADMTDFVSALEQAVPVSGRGHVKASHGRPPSTPGPSSRECCPAA